MSTNNPPRVSLYYSFYAELSALDTFYHRRIVSGIDRENQSFKEFTNASQYKQERQQPPTHSYQNSAQELYFIPSSAFPNRDWRSPSASNNRLSTSPLTYSVSVNEAQRQQKYFNSMMHYNNTPTGSWIDDFA